MDTLPTNRPSTRRARTNERAGDIRDISSIVHEQRWPKYLARIDRNARERPSCPKPQAHSIDRFCFSSLVCCRGPRTRSSATSTRTVRGRSGRRAGAARRDWLVGLCGNRKERQRSRAFREPAIALSRYGNPSASLTRISMLSERGRDWRSMS